jgi:hypothetical protein
MAAMITPQNEALARPVSNLAEALATIRQYANEVRLRGATALFIFGSVVRNELRSDSDIDMFIDYDPDGPLNYYKLCEMEDILSSGLGRKVDLTTREGLHPGLRQRIERSSIQVF